MRFVTPIEGDGGPAATAAAEARIERLMAKVLPRLPRFVPETLDGAAGS